MASRQTIQSQDVSIEEAFKSFYVVPSYQREYVWESEQVEQLLNDIHDEFASQITEAEYFIGSIVACPSGDGTLELIDGQQRMTTIYIALCAIRDHLIDLRVEAPRKVVDQISAPDTDRDGNEQQRFRLILQYSDSGNLLERIAQQEPPAKKKELETRSMKNISGTYSAVRQFLRRTCDNDPQKIKQFYGFFINCVKLIRIETESISKALKVFETINDRGVGLDSMDLLKNLLFMKSDRATFNELKSLWKELQDTIFSMKEKPLRFLRYFLISRYDITELREEQIYGWLTKNEALCGYAKNPIGFANDLVASAHAYANFIDGRDKRGRSHPHLQSLQFLSGRLRMHLILLLAGRHLTEDQFNQLTQEVEALFFCFLITREHTRTIDNHLCRWAMELRRVDSDDSLNSFIDRTLARQRASLSDRFNEEISRLSAESIAKYRLVYVLAKLTQAVQIQAYGENEETSSLRNFTDGGYEIEHILAQNATHDVISEFGDSVNEAIQRLGNLTLVEKSINASIGNKPFSEKQTAYRDSKLLLTRLLSGKLRIGENTRIDRAIAPIPIFEQWNKHSIEKRQEYLLSLARLVWRMPNHGSSSAHS